jgi:hypothetical protein
LVHTSECLVVAHQLHARVFVSIITQLLLDIKTIYFK